MQALRDGRLAGALLRRLAGRPAPALVYRLLCCLSEEVLVLALAQAGTESAKRRLVSFLERDRWVKPAVTGADLKALGLKPGPKYAQILQRLLDARLNGEVTTEQDERALAARLAAPLSRDAPSVR
jgi:tRNA nucleotidyltransferase (CCA-adding enzyme)